MTNTLAACTNEHIDLPSCRLWGSPSPPALPAVSSGCLWLRGTLTELIEHLFLCHISLPACQLITVPLLFLSLLVDHFSLLPSCPPHRRALPSELFNATLLPDRHAGLKIASRPPPSSSRGHSHPTLTVALLHSISGRPRNPQRIR